MNLRGLGWRPALALVAGAVLAQSAAAQLTKPVKVTGGLVQGVPGQDPAITVFKGIPFAAPPVGDLRWHAPQPVVPWSGVRLANKFGNSCIQFEVWERKPWTHEFMSHNDISEDCLYLNVWTPAKSSGEKLPVYVYFYGGGDVEGSSAVAVYDGEGLAKKGVIVVTPNYRLGIFGHFALPALTAESPHHSSGNQSELDLIAALKWVQNNIARFGGDPSKVTIGGQSAGSGHVFSMTVTPLAKGLFRGAINESGVSASVATAVPGVSGIFAGPGVSLAEGEKKGMEFMDAKGVKSLADLRHLSWQQIMEPVKGPDGREMSFRGDVIDGYVFPETARETYDQGKQNDVPTLTGYNRNDLFGPAPHPEITLAELQKQVQARYDGMSGEFFKLYPASNDAEAVTAYKDSTWDFTRSTDYLWAVWRAKTAKTPVYTYFWDHTLPGPDAAKYGAFHTSEVPYVMNTLDMSDRPFTAEDYRIADTMSSYWANFIKTGNPNGPGLAHWYSTSQKPWTTMELGNTDAPIPVAGDRAKEAFFTEYFSNPHPRVRP